jgi:hypothetical protein
MDEPAYPFSSEPIEIQYNFESISAEKVVLKVVRFTETTLPNVFNLALLDVLADGEESDLSVTNNDDMRTVLATVIRIIDSFLTKFPSVFVTFRGSDDRRTRLYRLVINRELAALQGQFVVLGQLENGTLESFQSGRSYRQFYVSRKI